MDAHEPSVSRITRKMAEFFFNEFQGYSDLEVYVSLRMYLLSFEEAIGDRAVAHCEERYYDLLYTDFWDQEEWMVC